MSLDYAAYCEAVSARFVFGGQMCQEPAVEEVECLDRCAWTWPHVHAVCEEHRPAKTTEKPSSGVSE